MASTADPDEVKSFAATLSTEHLACRTMQHRWQPFEAKWQKDDAAYLVTYLCDRCATTRTQWIDRFGDVVKGSYEYEDGYQHKGMGRIVGRGRSALRLENLTRLMGDRSAINRANRAGKKED